MKKSAPEEGGREVERITGRTDAEDSDGDEEVAEGPAGLHLGERKLSGGGSLAWRRCQAAGKGGRYGVSSVRLRRAIGRPR